MNILNQSVTIVTPLDSTYILKHLEMCGRIAYNSSDKTTEESYKNFIRSIIKRNHEAVLEHFVFTTKFKTNRAIANELTRHRHCSFVQESTRWVKYYNLNIIDNTPLKKNNPLDYAFWLKQMEASEKTYSHLIFEKVQPQVARGVLPLDLACDLVCTASVRQVRYMLNLRSKPDCHPQMIELMDMWRKELQSRVEILFD